MIIFHCVYILRCLYNFIADFMYIISYNTESLCNKLLYYNVMFMEVEYYCEIVLDLKQETNFILTSCFICNQFLRLYSIFTTLGRFQLLRLLYSCFMSIVFSVGPV